MAYNKYRHTQWKCNNNNIIRCNENKYIDKDRKRNETKQYNMYLFSMAKNVLWPPEMYKKRKRKKNCVHMMWQIKISKYIWVCANFA